MCEFKLTDEEAMDEIYFLLSGNEWGSDTLEELKTVVEKTGRIIEDCNEMEEDANA